MTRKLLEVLRINNGKSLYASALMRYSVAGTFNKVKKFPWGGYERQ
jgi:hypothetical protein